MICMTKKWYDIIIDSILESKTDVLFIVDHANMIEFPKLKEDLAKRFTKIVSYENELKLRRTIRDTIRDKEKILVVFRDKKCIPFDLFSTYATIEIDINSIFPLLNTDVLLQVPFDNYQEIYKEYLAFKKDRYDRLSESETRTFINNLLSSETIEERKKALELLESLKGLLTGPLTDYKIWGIISRTFGELKYLIDDKDLNIDVEKIRVEMSNKFKDYVLKYYENLIYSPNSLIHSNLLDIVFNDPDEKNALIAFDCMGFEEWNVIKDYLEKRTNLAYDIKYSFTMLPSETSYSGNALFGGLTPKRIKELEFINNIHWKNEESLFKYSLNKRMGIEKNLIYFKRCLDPRNMEIDLNSLNDYNAIGIFFSFIDRFTHQDLMNKSRLIQNISMHLKDSNLDVFIKSLLKQGFRVFFVSDHGSVFCRGNGISVKGDLVDSKAKRYLIVDKKELLEEYKTDNSEIFQFKNLIGDEFILLLFGNNMFAGRNDEGLTHGGISVEEMIVPLIEVKYNDRF